MRRIMVAVFAAAMVLGACSSGGGGGGGGNTTGGGGGSCPDLSSGPSFTIKAQDSLTFSPDCMTAKNTQKLELINTGCIEHTFTVVGTPVDVTLNGGQTQELAAPGSSLKPGTYVFYCKFHGSPDGSGMAGKIIVTG